MDDNDLDADGRALLDGFRTVARSYIGMPLRDGQPVEQDSISDRVRRMVAEVAEEEGHSEAESQASLDLAQRAVELELARLDEPGYRDLAIRQTAFFRAVSKGMRGDN